METRRLAVQLTHVWILFEGFFTVGRKLARQAVLTELFQTLKVIDVTMIGGLAKESVLTVDRGAICNIALAEDARVGLS